MFDITKCECEAITVMTDEYSNSVLSKNFKKFFPKLRRPSKKTINHCDHCINRYGLDICACGSGELPEKCEGGYHACGKPLQTLGESVAFVGWV